MYDGRSGEFFGAFILPTDNLEFEGDIFTADGPPLPSGWKEEDQHLYPDKKLEHWEVAEELRKLGFKPVWTIPN